MLNYLRHMTNISQRKLKKNQQEVTEEYWLNYASDALQPLDNAVSEVMNEIAHDMAEDLRVALFSKEIITDIAAIGGLAADTHIKCDETIDLLILIKGFQYTNSEYHAPYRPTLVDIILLRDFTKKYLKNKFPEALLDDSQPLALELSTKTLPCNFCYYFGYEQINPIEAFGNFSSNSTIKLLNYKSFTFEDSNPYNFISELTKKDFNTNGNTKPLIRIIKNLKIDAFEPIPLTGHQITSIIYSIDDYTLSKPPGQLLFLLLEISLFLKKLADDPFARRSLKSPDNLNLVGIHNEDSFLHGINHLKAELDSLIKHLVLEIDLYTDIYNTATVNP